MKKIILLACLIVNVFAITNKDKEIKITIDPKESFDIAYIKLSYRNNDGQIMSPKYTPQTIVINKKSNKKFLLTQEEVEAGIYITYISVPNTEDIFDADNNIENGIKLNLSGVSKQKTFSLSLTDKCEINSDSCKCIHNKLCFDLTEIMPKRQTSI